MIKPKSIIIIDGSNLYHKLKELKLTSLSNFNYQGFVNAIAKNTNIKSKYYCIGKIKAQQSNLRARQMMAKQQSLVTKLLKQGFTIQFGFLLKSNSRYHEKGVDVQIAVNLLKDAYHHIYDQAFLISSDSDLIPAIKEVFSLKKKVIYIGFKHKPSFALLRNCSQYKLLTKKDLLPFI